MIAVRTLWNYQTQLLKPRFVRETFHVGDGKQKWLEDVWEQKVEIIWTYDWGTGKGWWHSSLLLFISYNAVVTELKMMKCAPHRPLKQNVQERHSKFNMRHTGSMWLAIFFCRRKGNEWNPSEFQKLKIE